MKYVLEALLLGAAVVVGIVNCFVIFKPFMDDAQRLFFRICHSKRS